MKRTIKWLLLLSIIAGVGGYIVYQWQRRGPGPLWEPQADEAPDSGESSEPVVVETATGERQAASAPVHAPAALDEPLAPDLQAAAEPPFEPDLNPGPLPAVFAPAPPAIEPEPMYDALVETPFLPQAGPGAPQAAKALVSTEDVEPLVEPQAFSVLPSLESVAADFEAMAAEERFLERLAEDPAAPASEPFPVVRDSSAEGFPAPPPAADVQAPADVAVAPLSDAFEAIETTAAEPLADIADEAEAVLEAAAPRAEPSAAVVEDLPPAAPEHPVAAGTVEFKPPTPEPEVDSPPVEAPLSPVIEAALADVRPQPVPVTAGRDAESYLDEGNVYFNVGQYGLAIERYTRALELDPSLTAGHYNRANARTRAGEYDGALADYNHALELQPDDSDALNNRGMLHLYRANYDAALRDFNAALAIDPSDTTVMVNRGLAHLHGGAAADALVDFQEAASLDDSDAAAHYGAGQAAAVLGNRDEALKRLRRALQIDSAYAREAAADAKLSTLQGDSDFMKLLRDSGARR